MLLEVGVLYVVMAVSTQRGAGKGEPFSVGSCDEDKVVLVVGNAPSQPAVISSDLETAMAADLAQIPQVQHVMVEHADGNLLVWVRAEDTSIPVRERLFAKQFALMEAFPEVSFDFNLVASKNRSAPEIASGARIVYAR